MTPLAWNVVFSAAGVVASWYGGNANPGSPALRVWGWVKAPFSWLARKVGA